jgi:transposase
VNNLHEKHLPHEPVKANGRNVVGIDIGRKNHVAAGVRASGDLAGPKITFTNDRPGIDRLEKILLAPLGGPANVLVAMEATGHYWMPVCFELTRRGYECAVINPIQTRAKFRTRIRKSKTDKIDSESIARLALGGEAHTARIPEEPVFELRMLARHRWRLVGQIGDLKRFALTLVDRVFPEFATSLSNPLGPTGRAIAGEIGLAPSAVASQRERFVAVAKKASHGKIKPQQANQIVDRAVRSIGIRQGEQVLVDQLRTTIALMEATEAQRDALDEVLEQRVAALHSPLTDLGLSAPIVATIHGESDPISDFPHAWQYAAFAGIEPSTFASGGYVRTSDTPISKRGSPYLRHALYLAAVSVYRKHTFFKRSYQRHRARGRHHTDALVIVAHKLARVTWRLLTDNRRFTARPPKHQPDIGVRRSRRTKKG